MINFTMPPNTSVTLYRNRKAYDDSKQGNESIFTRTDFASIYDKQQVIIDKIKAMDNNASDLTLSDLAKAKKAGIDGVKSIKYDGNAGVGSFELESGEVLVIDFETDYEKNYKPTEEEKLEQFKKEMQTALNNGFDEYYDMKLSDDGKMLIVTIKILKHNHTKATGVIQDFGLESGVLAENNEELLYTRIGKEPGSILDRSNGESLNHADFKDGDVLYIPVSEIKFSKSPSKLRALSTS